MPSRTLLEPAYGVRRVERRAGQCLEHCRRRLGLKNIPLPVPVDEWIESALGRIKAPVRLYPGIWPNTVFMPYGQGHETRISWGRNTPARMAVGVNPHQLLLSGSETHSGQAVTNPVRVRIYRAQGQEAEG